MHGLTNTAKVTTMMFYNGDSLRKGLRKFYLSCEALFVNLCLRVLFEHGFTARNHKNSIVQAIEGREVFLFKD